jgi:hypothetical protein
MAEPTGAAFIDATSLDVCDPHRIHSHRVFRGAAQRGETSTGWFFGFKPHLIINDRGELLAVKFTAGNVDDRKPVADMAEGLAGKMVGDKGYISQPLFNQLWEQGVQLITGIKKNMKNKTDAAVGQDPAAQAHDHRIGSQYPEKPMPHRTLPPSQPYQFHGASGRGARRLCLAAQTPILGSSATIR